MRYELSKLRGSFSGEHGFTLMETLLTLTIISVLFLILLASLRVGVSAWERGERVTQEISFKRAMSSRFTKDIGSAMPFIERQADEKEYTFRGDQSSLSFESGCKATEPIACGGSKLLRYEMKKNEGLLISAKTVPSVQEKSFEKADSFEEVSEAMFEYLGDAGWEGEWDAESKGALPVAVRVRLVMKNSQSPVIITAQLNMH